MHTGTAAMADLSSNSTSLRLIMTTRAKLAEVSANLSVAAAAAAGGDGVGGSSGSAAGSSMAGGHTSAGASNGGGGSSAGASSAASAAASAACPAGVTALPLQPWAWPWSAQCGGKSSSGSSGSNQAAKGPGHQLLRGQRPPLPSVLQEMANTAASIHRRVMIYLRSQETAMQT